MARNDTEERLRPRTRHTITMDNRERVLVTGVSDVGSFNEAEAILTTDCGELAISGEDLHMPKLNLDDGQLVIEGQIFALEYIEHQPQKSGFFSRVFR